MNAVYHERLNVNLYYLGSFAMAFYEIIVEELLHDENLSNDVFGKRRYFLL